MTRLSSLLGGLVACLFLARLYAQTADMCVLQLSDQPGQPGMAYRYEQAGKPNGKTVLLLHGKNFSQSYWDGTAEYLLSKGYHVLRPDQVGFGRSSKASCYPYTFQQLAVNTRRLLDSLHTGPVTVIGHSMGGMLATRFALMYPGMCERLILENPIGLEDWKAMVPYSTVDEEYLKEKKKTRESLKAYFIQNYFHGEWKPAYEPVLEETTALQHSPDSLAYARCMALTTDMIFTQPVCYEFSRLRVPTYLIIGLADKTAIGRERADPGTASRMGNYPVLARQVSAQIPKGTLLELPGIGHIPHLENFEAFTRALDEALLP